MKTIHLIAPSFGCSFDPYLTRLLISIKNLKKLGFKIIEGENIYLNEGLVSSNTAEKRACEFMKAYLNDDVDIIMSVGGGELMCDILPFINFEKLKGVKPKLFIGYSDNTNLTFTLTTFLNIHSIYGPNAPSFYLDKLKYFELQTIKMINGQKNFSGFKKYQGITKSTNPLAKLKLTEEKIITPFNYQKPFKGTLIGGCLDCLITLCGTKYDNVKEYIKNHKEGLIWFLEACDLNPIAIRRALFNLKEAGWFNNATGFIIGRPLCMNQETFGINRINAVTDILKDLNVPILLDIDLGHIPPQMPIKCGAKAKISYQNNNIHIKYL